MFYTILPLPPGWVPSFDGIAALAPLVGLALGAGLGLVDGALAHLGISPLLGSALVVGLGLWLTGGLHLDGAMDTADGLAVFDPSQRLAVMADSRTGAFGVMVAIAILGFKTLALADLAMGRGWILASTLLWGRWAQVVVIARYPYLKAEGKGALHKIHLRPVQDVLLGLGLGVALSGLWVWQSPAQWWLVLWLAAGSLVWALLVGFWFHWRLGGHTGDTYGATVEWTEVGVLVLATALTQML